MNARVLLLVLVTGLFMASWRSDQYAIEAALARNYPSRQILVSDPQFRNPLVTSELTSAHRQAASNANGRFELAPDLKIQLEDGIAPGVYQAVSESGQIHRLTVSGGEHGTTSCGNERRVVMARDAGAVRWYLIPITPQNAL